jgi:hypothetical protein
MLYLLKLALEIRMLLEDAVDLHADDIELGWRARLPPGVSIMGRHWHSRPQSPRSATQFAARATPSRRNRVIMVLSGSLFGRAAEEIGASSRPREVL